MTNIYRIAVYGLVIGFVIVWFLLHIIVMAQAGVFDDEETKAEVAWFNTPQISSCCGLGDAFTADDFVQVDGKYYAIITEGTDRYYHMEDVIPIGTRIEIPEDIYEKAKDLPPNPTGHGIVFLHVFEQTQPDGSKIIIGNRMNVSGPVKPEEADVICYFPPAGN